MKIRIWVAAAILFLACSVPGYAQEYGRLRALQQRAAQVTNLKNAFVAGVLASYRIEHERNSQGIVVRINIDGRWQDITAIEIVPVMTETADKGRRLTGHELLFTTAEGTLDLLSDMAVR
jgi:hypothetical protein